MVTKVYHSYLQSEKNEQPDGKNKTFTRLKSMMHDPLLTAKLKFFKMVAGKVNSFLRGFQTDAPVNPFVANTIGDLVHDFLRRIILKDVFKKCSSLSNLIHHNP